MQAPVASPRRFISVGVVALLHVIVIYALASGLAAQLVDKIPQDIKADIIKDKPPDMPKAPPPPPPDLVKPPPPFIPPPDIVIANDAPTNTITAVTNVVQPPAPPKPAAVPATLAAGRGNNCASRYYPPLAVRLNHEGSTILTVHIGANGSVSAAEVGTSSGFSELDQAAVQCVTAQWRFTPATQNGAPVESTKQYKIVWKLTG
ncbi:MAG TPA: energy transducer TonB [Rhizomicrobium sp.]